MKKMYIVNFTMEILALSNDVKLITAAVIVLRLLVLKVVADMGRSKRWSIF